MMICCGMIERSSAPRCAVGTHPRSLPSSSARPPQKLGVRARRGPARASKSCARRPRRASRRGQAGGKGSWELGRAGARSSKKTRGRAAKKMPPWFARARARAAQIKLTLGREAGNHVGDLGVGSHRALLCCVDWGVERADGGRGRGGGGGKKRGRNNRRPPPPPPVSTRRATRPPGQSRQRPDDHKGDEQSHAVRAGREFGPRGAGA
jgi:hypothetical protein